MPARTVHCAATSIPISNSTTTGDNSACKHSSCSPITKARVPGTEIMTLIRARRKDKIRKNQMTCPDSLRVTFAYITFYSRLTYKADVNCHRQTETAYRLNPCSYTVTAYKVCLTPPTLGSLHPRHRKSILHHALLQPLTLTLPLLHRPRVAREPTNSSYTWLDG
jgi:hypothetical protein